MKYSQKFGILGCTLWLLALVCTLCVHTTVATGPVNQSSFELIIDLSEEEADQIFKGQPVLIFLDSVESHSQQTSKHNAARASTVAELYTHYKLLNEDKYKFQDGRENYRYIPLTLLAELGGNFRRAYAPITSTENLALQQQFGLLPGEQLIVYLKNGQCYEYHGLLNAEDLVKFATQPELFDAHRIKIPPYFLVAAKELSGTSALKRIAVRMLHKGILMCETVKTKLYIAIYVIFSIAVIVVFSKILGNQEHEDQKNK